MRICGLNDSVNFVLDGGGRRASWCGFDDPRLGAVDDIGVGGGDAARAETNVGREDIPHHPADVPGSGGENHWDVAGNGQQRVAHHVGESGADENEGEQTIEEGTYPCHDSIRGIIMQWKTSIKLLHDSITPPFWSLVSLPNFNLPASGGWVVRAAELSTIGRWLCAWLAKLETRSPPKETRFKQIWPNFVLLVLWPNFVLLCFTGTGALVLPAA